MEDRQAMTAIRYGRRKGCRWQDLPRRLGAASTVYDRYREWQQAGAFLRMQEVGLWEEVMSLAISDKEQKYNIMSVIGEVRLRFSLATKPSQMLALQLIKGVILIESGRQSQQKQTL